MPIYVYKCDNCKEEFEIEQSIKSSASAECPKCQTTSEHRLIAGSSFVLTGGGWGKDLYSKK